MSRTIRRAAATHTATAAPQQKFRDRNGQISVKPTSTDDRIVPLGLTATGGRPSWLRVGRHAGRPHDPMSFDGSRRSSVSAGTLAATGAEACPDRLGARGGACFALDRPRRVVGVSSPGRYVDQTHPGTYVLPIALALIQRPAPRLTLRANIGATRVPTMFERYGNTARSIPTDLRPESGIVPTCATAAWAAEGLALRWTAPRRHGADSSTISVLRPARHQW
jgi:hypothetical protein